MKRLLIISVVLFCSSLAWANACTLAGTYTSLAASSGNWTGTGCTTVPGNGDTATVSATLTVASGETWIIGASGANNTTAAITLGTVGKVLNNGTVRARGDIIYTAGAGYTTDAWVNGAGSTFIWDSSQSVSPTTTRYRFGPSADGGYRPIRFNGSSPSPVTVTSDLTNSAQTGLYWIDTVGGSGRTQYGNMVATWTQFSNLGDASTAAIEFGLAGNTYGIYTFSISNSSFNKVGPILSLANTATNTVTVLDSNTFTNSPGPYNFYSNFATAIGTGTRQITNNSFDKQIMNKAASCGGAQGNVQDLTLMGNFFTDLCLSGSSAPWASSSYNFMRNTYGSGNTISTISDASYWYVFKDMTVADNPHFLLGTTINPSTVSYSIFESPEDVTGDSGEMYDTTSNPTGVTSYKLTYSILVPSKTGRSTAELGSIVSSVGNAKHTFDHNTWIGGVPVGAEGFGAVQIENGTATTGNITEIKNNIMWGPSSGVYPFFKYRIQPSNPATITQDVVSPANADYNVGYNTSAVTSGANDCTNCTPVHGVNSYIGNFSSSTIGAHDLNGVNPGFVDPYRRNVALADTRLFLNAAGPQWLTSTSYTVGQVVSDTNANVYGGATVNYRCTVAHTSGASTEPNVGASWRTNWEFATLQDLRNNPQTNITALINWVRGGFAPTNPALHNAGSDGLDIGAVPVVLSATNPFWMFQF